MLNSGGERKRGYSALTNRSADNDIDYHSSDKLALITNALEEATSLIKSRGLVPGMNNGEKIMKCFINN